PFNENVRQSWSALTEQVSWTSQPQVFVFSPKCTYQFKFARSAQDSSLLPQLGSRQINRSASFKQPMRNNDSHE
ncbi:hypothetical protein T265_14580, partial [Opisthorchis viverrini]